MNDEQDPTDGDRVSRDWNGVRTDVEGPSTDPYIESQIIMMTVRVVAPFALTYGLFLMFHGADTPGGSFQGGAIIGATVLMVAFAFGIEPTRDWLRNRTVVALAAGGTALFTLVGLVPVLAGESFLAHPFYEERFGIDTKWALEAIEIGGVAPIVAGVVVGLFFIIAAGVSGGPDDPADGELRADGGPDGPTADGEPGPTSGADGGPVICDNAGDGDPGGGDTTGGIGGERR